MSLGPWQILLVLAVVLIVFGAGKLPKVMGDFGKGIKNLKSGLKDDYEESTSAKKEPENKPKKKNKIKDKDK